MQTELRWQQRFTNFDKPFLLLKKILLIKQPTDAESIGIIQTFNFTFELGWKTLKDYLLQEGFDTPSPRATIKQSYQSGYISDGEAWLDALDKRNLMAHTYDETRAKEALALIREKYFSFLQELHKFFSGKL